MIFFVKKYVVYVSISMCKNTYTHISKFLKSKKIWYNYFFLKNKNDTKQKIRSRFYKSS